MRHERAGNLESLQHTARERGRKIIDPLCVNFDLTQPTQRRLAYLTIVPASRGHQSLADISSRRNSHPQIISCILVNESPLGSVQRSQHRR